MAQGIQCSFLLNIYYLHVNNKLEFDEFVFKFDRNDFSYSTWHKKRKLARSSLLTRSSYKNSSKDGEDKQFISYFTLENFSLLTAEQLIGWQQRIWELEFWIKTWSAKHKTRGMFPRKWNGKLSKTRDNAAKEQIDNDFIALYISTVCQTMGCAKNRLSCS